MKIRSRLLLFILPFVLGTIVFGSFFIYYSWYNDIISFSRLSFESPVEAQITRMQGIIVVLAILSVLIIMMGVAIIANNFSKLIEQLKTSALMIAAGYYKKKVEITGPQEIQELANTLNTMSECMQENVLRIEESSLLREKMIGESEALRLLQSRIVSDFLDEFSHPEFSLYAIDKPGNDEQRILFFDTTVNTDSRLDLEFIEAQKIGFDGIVSLLKRDSDLGKLHISLEKQDAKHWLVTSEQKRMPSTLIWSSEKETLFVAKEKELLLPEDLLIIVNFGLDRAMRDEDTIQKWFSRVFSHFAHVGIDACMTLLNNELSFLSEKKHSHAPLLAVCLQRKVL